LCLVVATTLSSVSKGGISPLLAVFALEDSRVHVCTLYGSNKTFYIEVPVD